MRLCVSLAAGTGCRLWLVVAWPVATLAGIAAEAEYVCECAGIEDLGTCRRSAAALSAEFGKHIGQETRRMSVGPGQRRRAGSRTKYTEEQ